MSNQYLKLRRSSIPGKVPTTSSLDYGEIALNTYDGLAFIKKSGSNGEEIVTIGAAVNSFTGSFSGSFTGSFQGTASWANNVISSSFASTASFANTATSSSFATTTFFAQTASFATTASFVQNAISSSFATTASFVQNTISSSFASTASFAQTASFVRTAQTASFVQTAQTASYVLNAISSSFASTASFSQTASFVQIAQTASFVQNAISSSFATTASFAQIAQTASFVQNVVSSSFATTASYVLNAVSSSYAQNSNIQYVTNSIQELSQIEVLDYSDDVVVDFTNGRLKFIFGAPATQSISSFSFNGTFLTDRFNRVLDGYTASAVWNNGGYTLISASIFEGATLLAQTNTGTSLNYATSASGSRTYVLHVTASNPSNGTILVQSASLSGTLSKSNPGSPTITPAATIQLGASSNQIEQGATGSITFTTASGAANGWSLNFLTSSITTPIFVTGSLTGSTSIVIAATASYSSSGINGSDNSPALVTAITSTSTFTKIRSLRSGASVSSSFTQAEIENISGWDTTIGGSIGTILKGTTTVSGQSVTINWTGDKFHYIVYDLSRPALTNITAAGFGVFSAFTSFSLSQYRVYKTNLLQAGGTGTTITYVLT